LELGIILSTEDTVFVKKNFGNVKDFLPKDWQKNFPVRTGKRQTLVANNCFDWRHSRKQSATVFSNCKWHCCRSNLWHALWCVSDIIEPVS